MLGAGYWALVVRPIITPLLAAGGMWFKTRWRPGRPRITAGVKNALKLGLNITGYSLFDFASRFGDRIAIGSRAGAAVLVEVGPGPTFVAQPPVDAVRWADPAPRIVVAWRDPSGRITATWQEPTPVTVAWRKP